MKQTLKVKKNGDIEQFIVFFFVFVSMAVIFVGYIYWTASVEKCYDLQRIANEYQYRIESDGYLTETNKESLLENLTDNGLKNISLDDTDFIPIQYGQEVKLHIQGDVEVYDFKVDFVKLEFKFDKKDVRFDVTRKTTSHGIS